MGASTDMNTTGAKGMPAVTVGVPVYNHEAYVVECLDSIRDSDYPNIHLVVVDDGSSDGSFEKAKAWVERNRERFISCHIETKANEGLVKTANRILSLRKGEYFTLLASDDRLTPESLRRRVAYLEATPRHMAVFGDCRVIDGQGRVVGESWLRQWAGANLFALVDGRRIRTELVLRWSVPGPSMLARSLLYDPQRGIGGYREGLKIEDREFFLRILARDWLGFLDFPVAFYRVHDKNTFLEMDVKAAEDFVVAECGHRGRFQGGDRLVLGLRCFYYRVKRRRRAKGWDYYPMLSLEALLYGLLKLGFITWDGYLALVRWRRND